MSGRFECKQHSNPVFALGLAVDLLQFSTPFINFNFKTIANDLSGQISRKHYVFTFEDNKPVGYLGWCFATKEIAEKWAYHNYIPTYEEGLAGDCLLGFYFIAKSKSAAYFQTKTVRNRFPDKTLYWKRFYPNGKIRVVTVKPLKKNPILK